jgi:hypothetical protein
MPSNEPTSESTVTLQPNLFRGPRSPFDPLRNRNTNTRNSNESPRLAIIPISGANIEPSTRIEYQFHAGAVPIEEAPIELVNSIKALFSSSVMDVDTRRAFLQDLPLAVLKDMLIYRRNSQASTLAYSSDSTVTVEDLLLAFRRLIALGGQLGIDKGIQMLANAFKEAEINYAVEILEDEEWMV